MAPPTFLTIAEQAARHIRSEILRGRWSETLPGLPTLAKELGINSKTVEAGLRILESEGILIGQGAGRRRRIVLPDDRKSSITNESVFC